MFPAAPSKVQTFITNRLKFLRNSFTLLLEWVRCVWSMNCVMLGTLGPVIMTSRLALLVVTWSVHIIYPGLGAVHLWCNSFLQFYSNWGSPELSLYWLSGGLSFDILCWKRAMKPSIEMLFRFHSIQSFKQLLLCPPLIYKCTDPYHLLQNLGQLRTLKNKLKWFYKSMFWFWLYVVE